MRAHWVPLAFLAVCLAPQPPLSAHGPPAMFSPWYAEALRGVATLEPADVARLDSKLAANPTDAVARLQLMAYHQRADQAGRAASRAKRLQHALWLIEHNPASELLHSPVSRFAQGQLTAAESARAAALWDAAARSRPRDAAVHWNAASFFEGLDAERHLRALEATAAADPNHPFALRPLAHAYALALVNGGPLAARARNALEASKNLWVLGNAAYMLQSQYNQTLQQGQSLQQGATGARLAALAERYFLRAKALDPNLDRNAILPVVDLGQVARARERDEADRRDWTARAAQASAAIERMPLESFPELPLAVADTLRARGCRVPQLAPQPEAASRPRNAIRGEFFARGEEAWAVLCSVRESTALLVFRNARDRNPATLSTSEDRAYLQGLGEGNIGYSREITAVERNFIIGHYRAYGGPKPPPIEHHGIDDAFLGKASVTWYFHAGKWLRLQGAD